MENYQLLCIKCCSGDDDEKRKQMEDMVRGELDDWSPDSTTASLPQ